MNCKTCGTNMFLKEHFLGCRYVWWCQMCRRATHTLETILLRWPNNVVRSQVKSDDGWERNEILLRDTEMNRAKAFGDPYVHHWDGTSRGYTNQRERVACGIWKMAESRTVKMSEVTCPQCKVNLAQLVEESI